MAAKRMWCFVHFDLQMCFAPQRRAIFEHRNFKKWLRHMWCFVHFDLQMCFAPQRRAIFEHRNFQNGSANVVFCAFWLANVLRATAACHFWTSELQKVLRHRVVFLAFWLPNVLFATAACHFSPVCWTATSAPAALASLLFEHQEPRIIEKTQRFATSLTFFAHVPSF